MEVEFKLFGALSVKQFAYLASGILGGLFIYFLPFPTALRFVLIIISVLLGLFLSLVKINGQYSSVWLANFIVSMFTSQERVWKKSGVVPDVFREEIKKTREETLEKVKKEGRIKASVSPLTKFEVKNEPTVVDRSEELRLKEIEQQLFATQTGQSPDNLEKTVEEIFIKGYVLNKSSQPVRGALVSINAEQGDFIKETTTDANGYFDLGVALSPGVYFANIAAPKLNFDYYKLRLKPSQNIIYKFIAK